MKRIITLCLIAFTITAQSQNFEWLETIAVDFSINPDMVNYNTTTDTQGNIYMAGIKDNISFNCVDLMGGLILNKYNPNGSLMFSKSFTGTGAIFSLDIDSNGEIVMAMGYTSSITLGTTTLTANEFSPNFIIVKLDAQGNYLWHNQLVMENAEEWDFVSSLRAMTVDSNNNVYVGYDNFFNSFVDKYSATGEKLFTITQLFTSRITSLSIDSEGNIYGAGSCAGPMSTFAGVEVPATADLNYNTYLVKYSPAGAYQWIKYVKDITCTEPQVVAYSPNDIYFSSVLWQPTQFDNIQMQGSASFLGDFFLAKLNSEGIYQWVSEVPETEGEMTLASRDFLHVDLAGNPYLIGRTRRSINWTSQIATSVEGFSSDAILLKYCPEGEVTMAATAGAVDYEDRFDRITTNADGDIFLSGIITGGNVIFGNISQQFGEFETIPFLTKVTNGVLGIINPLQNGTPALYPNPASNHFYISNLETGTKGSIYTTIGQKVLEFAVNNTTPINIETLSAGTYIVKTESQKAIKFIKH